MIFNKKKFYSLLDIKNQIVYTPLIFVFFLATISIIVLYFFLNHKEKNKTELLIQSESYYKKNVLKSYIGDVKFNTSANFDSLEIDLSNYLYTLKGYIKAFDLHNKKTTILDLKKYITEVEDKNDVNFIFFDSQNYQVLYGNDLLEYLRIQTNSKLKTEKFKYYMLKNIQYIGDDNLMYWINNKRLDLRLSYFKHFKNKNIIVGAFSKIHDMKSLTKKAILDSLVQKSKTVNHSYFTFYDENEQTIYNYDGKGEKKSIKDIRNFNLVDEEGLVYNFSKYNYKVYIKSSFLEEELKKIKGDFEYKFVMGTLIIVFISLSLIASANIFGRFINTIFNRYNRRLERKNILLSKWKDRYELAIIASNDGLWDIDLNTNKIFFSNKWLDMFGYKRDEIQNFKEWLNLIHKEDKDEVLKKFTDHLSGESEHFICEYRLKDKYGDYKWVLVRGKAFSNDIENRMLMMSMDIDNRMKLTKELRDVEMLTEFGRIVIFRWANNEELTVNFVSKSISSYGYETADFEFSKVKYFDFVYEKDIPLLQEVISNAIRDDVKSFTHIHRVVDKDKNIKWVWNRTILVKDDYGEVISLYGYLNDITKIKMNEEDLKIRVEEELTKNLEKDRLLIQQNKMASMGEMLGNIAHQWRQPLNNINLLLYFIRDNFNNFTKDDLGESINSAKLQIDYMSQTIDDFRNFYQPTKDKKLFNIKESITLSSRIVQSAFETNNVSLNIEGDDIKIENYENEFEQVIVNILNNAVDAAIVKMEEVNFSGKVDIKVENQGDTNCITIINNCGNINEDTLDRIFEPYFTTKFEDQGTGIGLYMSKVIIEKNMNGSIEAVNENDGVKFIINLPS